MRHILFCPSFTMFYWTIFLPVLRASFSGEQFSKVYNKASQKFSTHAMTFRFTLVDACSIHRFLPHSRPHELQMSNSVSPFSRVKCSSRACGSDILRSVFSSQRTRKLYVHAFFDYFAVQFLSREWVCNSYLVSTTISVTWNTDYKCFPNRDIVQLVLFPVPTYYRSRNIIILRRDYSWSNFPVTSKNYIENVVLNGIDTQSAVAASLQTRFGLEIPFLVIS